EQRPARALKRGREGGQVRGGRQDPAGRDGLPCVALSRRHLAWWRHQWLAKREVDVHRTFRRLSHSPCRKPSPHPRSSRNFDGRPRVEEPTHSVAIELLLIDRLVGTHVSELRWAVG